MLFCSKYHLSISKWARNSDQKVHSKPLVSKIIEKKEVVTVMSVLCL